MLLKFEMMLDSNNRNMHKFSDPNGRWTEDPELIEEYIESLSGEEKTQAIMKYRAEEYWNL